METVIYPTVIHVTNVKKAGKELELPANLTPRCLLFYHQKDAPLPHHRYYIGKEIPENWVDGVIIRGSIALKICKIENDYRSTYADVDCYAYLYLELVEDCPDLVEREKTIKEELLVFSDRLEDLGELEMANNLRKTACERSVLILTT